MPALGMYINVDIDTVYGVGVGIDADVDDCVGAVGIVVCGAGVGVAT